MVFRTWLYKTWFGKFCIWCYKNDISLLVRLGLRKGYNQLEYEKRIKKLTQN